MFALRQRRGCENVIGAHDSRRGREKDPLLSKWSHRKKKRERGREKKTAFISGEMFIFRRRLPLPPPALLQRSLARPSRARVAAVPPRRLPVKRRCLLFLKEYGSTQPLPATAVFLKCNLCLSFCRGFFFLPLSGFYIGEYSNRMCHYAFCVK